MTAVSDETGRAKLALLIQEGVARMNKTRRTLGFNLDDALSLAMLVYDNADKIAAALSAAPVGEPDAWLMIGEKASKDYPSTNLTVYPNVVALWRSLGAEVIPLYRDTPPAKPADVGALTKRPSAFRVPRAINDGAELSSEAYRLFNDEAEARSAAEAAGVDYEGLYLAKDRPAAGVGADEIARAKHTVAHMLAGKSFQGVVGPWHEEMAAKIVNAILALTRAAEGKDDRTEASTHEA